MIVNRAPPSARFSARTVAAVQLDQVLDDRQAEAGAAGIARARLVDAVEALEHARQILVGNARALVGHRRSPTRAVAARAPRSRIVVLLGRVGGRVRDQIAQRVVQLGRIGAHASRRPARSSISTRWLRALERRRDVGDDRLRRALRVSQRDEVERLLAGVEPRQPQQILDQPLHPLRVARDDLEKAAAVLVAPRRRRTAPRRSRGSRSAACAARARRWRRSRAGSDRRAAAR